MVALIFCQDITVISTFWTRGYSSATQGYRILWNWLIWLSAKWLQLEHCNNQDESEKSPGLSVLDYISQNKLTQVQFMSNKAWNNIVNKHFHPN